MRLLEELGRPQRAFKVAQVAGTNGKGSTTRMLAALLAAHGDHTGAFTSPYLLEYREQVQIDGLSVGDELFGAGVSAALEAAARCAASLAEPATQFELLTVAVLWMLRAAAVRWAVLETGMGGRWDSTTATDPALCVLTSVGLDHVAFLGPTVEDIARDKAYVIRAGAPCVLGPGTEHVDAVFAERARLVSSSLTRVRMGGDVSAGDVTVTVAHASSAPDDPTVIDVQGAYATYADLAVNGPPYQAENAGCAIAAAEIALGRDLDPRMTRRALGELHVEGRFEVLGRDPWLIADVGHNEAGARALATALRGAFGGRKVTVLLGMLADKDAASVVRVLAPLAERFVVAGLPGPRGLSGEALRDIVREVTGTEPACHGDVTGAMDDVLEAGGDCVVTGSHVTVAQARLYLGVG